MNSQTKQLLILLKALAEENRIHLLRLLHEHEYSVGDLAERVSLSEPTVSHHLTRLREAGLVNLRTAGTQRFYRVNPNGIMKFKHLAAEIEQLPAEEKPAVSDDRWIEKLGWPKEDSKVLRDYTRGGKLTRIPLKKKKMMVVLRWLSTLFQPDTMYTEKEVNTIIRAIYAEDHVALRRGLIDMGYLRRERGGGQYWLAPSNEKPALI